MAGRPKAPSGAPSSTDMPKSAFMGQSAANERDRMIVRGAIISSSWPNVPRNLTGARGLSFAPAPHPRPTDSHAGRIIASDVAAIVVVLIFTGIRVVAKSRSKRSRLGWEDWFIAFAALAFVGYTSIGLDQVCRGGVGKYRYNVTYAELENRAASSGVSYWLIFFVIVPTKLSIICFNARLTGLTSLIWRWVHRISFILICAYGLFYIPWYAFTWNPTAAFYSYVALAKAQNPRPRHAVLASSRTTYLVIHIASDWLLLSIPIYLVTKLHMPLGKKLRCIIPISVGCLSAIGAILANYYRGHRSDDPSFNRDRAVNFRHLDLVCAIIATSLPSVASVCGRHLKLPLPSSLQRLFSTDRGLPVYEINPSNPFGSDQPDNGRKSPFERRGILPDVSNEYVGGGDAEQMIDVDVASHRLSGPWVIDSKRRSCGDGGQWPLKS